ncbi:MAG: zinc metalloprotease HtpX [Bacteroidetes bacterium]|jgi:heat shock protein HtpX|nr:zinc metalloprotease HtpX [Bacteroidota bacterium]
MKNTLKTVFFMTLMMVLFLFIGNLIGGRTGLTYAFFFSLVMNFFAYWFSDKMVLRSYHAKEVTEAEAPKLYAIVHRLAASADIPMPKLYIVPTQTPNAFATGRSPQHAAVAVTEGILPMLSDDELEAVIGHELSHVIHRDILVSTIVATFATAIAYTAQMLSWSMLFFGGGRGRDDDSSSLLGELLVIIVAPIAAMLIQMAVSRSREYKADEGGAQLSRKPLSLASALRKLQAGAERLPMQASPSTAHLFIVNPLNAQRFARLFSTHPPTEERIARLEAFAAGRDLY